MRVTSAKIFRCNTAALAAMVVAASVTFADSSQAAPLVLRCMNTTSGWTWNVTIDLDRNTADTYPASITERDISWSDAKEGASYAFNRKTGALTQYNASSMGGNMLFHKCQGG
jgi:hypothetical protein